MGVKTKYEIRKAELIKELREDEQTIKKLCRQAKDQRTRNALRILFRIVVVARHKIEFDYAGGGLWDN